MPRGIIALVFRCKITGGQLTANDEVTAFHWADEADIRQLTSSPAHQLTSSPAHQLTS